MGRIRRAALAALLVSAVLGTGAAPAAEEGGGILAKIAGRYAGVRTLSARFRQEVPLANVGIVRKAEGTVYFQRPLRMRWDYKAPEAQLFLADGKYSYFRPPDSPQVFRRKMDERSLGGKIPLLLLFGTGNIGDFFRVESASPRKGGGETLLSLVPRGDGAPDVRRIDLVVASDTSVVREVHIYDRLGGSNHLFLDDLKFNPALSPDLFRFRKPAGTEVVDG